MGHHGINKLEYPLLSLLQVELDVDCYVVDNEHNESGWVVG